MVTWSPSASSPSGRSPHHAGHLELAAHDPDVAAHRPPVQMIPGELVVQRRQERRAGVAHHGDDALSPRVHEVQHVVRGRRAGATPPSPARGRTPLPLARSPARAPDVNRAKFSGMARYLSDEWFAAAAARLGPAPEAGAGCWRGRSVRCFRRRAAGARRRPRPGRRGARGVARGGRRRGPSIHAGPHPSPTVAFSQDYAHRRRGREAGRSAPREAFMTGRITMSGDAGALRRAPALAAGRRRPRPPGLHDLQQDRPGRRRGSAHSAEPASAAPEPRGPGAGWGAPAGARGAADNQGKR